MIHSRPPTIIVCGDIMLDHYIYTKIDKIANEAPIPVFRFLKEEYTLGGCGNVLRNLHSIGCAGLHIFSAIGDDIMGRRISDMIDEMGIHTHLSVERSGVTTTKTRYFSDNKVVFRCDTEAAHTVDISAILIDMEDCIRHNTIDCIILSDYDKGFLTKDVCRAIIALANRYNVFTCVDPKRDYTKYVGCSLIKPNRTEARRLVGAAEDTPDEVLHRMLREKVCCRYSVITMSEEGISLNNGEATIHARPTVHKVVDVTGAGDIVTCILGYYVPLGVDLSDVIRMATTIATISVEHPGTYTITKGDITGALIRRGGLITMDEIAHIRDIHPEKRIVFTNGCFDLLHRGHLELLRFCRAHGDIVVVGVNSDSSVKVLKGDTRPIQLEETRAHILSELACVDYVVIFEELTPINILQALRPDVLVKGGDYTVDSIVGREYAGETVIFNTLEGISTSNTIEHIVKRR